MTHAFNDEQIEDELTKSGGSWTGSDWRIEDACLHPYVRKIESRVAEALMLSARSQKPKRNKWPKKHYSEVQKKWCDEYEQWTGFEPIMGDYEAGRMTFCECAKASVRWYEMHTSDMHLRVSSMPVPKTTEQATA